MIKVNHYSADKIGGAARAATRLHRALRENRGIDSRMIVLEKSNDDHTIHQLNNGRAGHLCNAFYAAVDGIPRRITRSTDEVPRSAAWSSRLTAKKMNSSSCDVTHLHWINGGLLSIEQIGKLTKPLVWTLHDMWAFCGSEHLATDSETARWRTGYRERRKNSHFDLDRWAWKRKKKSWTRPMQIVAPSQWLADCVRQSELMSSYPIHVIPNPLDTNSYKPMNKLAARGLLNLPRDRDLILFGAINGTKLPYKGWDLLLPALQEVGQLWPDADAVVFGQGRPQSPPWLPFNVHWMGHVYDDFTLAALYSAADVLVVPSRQEAFGQTGSEAQACGCPVVGFDATGIRDVVSNGISGLLVKPYDASALAQAILKLLGNKSLREQFSLAARKRAIRLWSFENVSVQYENVYKRAIDEL